jgi:hypothetical protein
MQLGSSKDSFPCFTRLNPCVAHCSTESIPWVLTLKGRRVPWLRRGICPLANPYELWYEHTLSTYFDLSLDEFRVRLFPFSLAGKNDWYFQQEKEVTTDRKNLRDEFCAKYFPLSRLMNLPNHIINFRQTKTESLSQAWTRFHGLIHTCLDHGLPDIVSI